TSLVDGDRATADFLQVQRLDGRVCLVLVRHLDETESPRPAGHLIHDDRHGRHFAVRRKGLTQIVLGRLVRQIAHVDVRHLQPRKIKKTSTLGGQDRKKRTCVAPAVEPNSPNNSTLTRRVLEINPKNRGRGARQASSASAASGFSSPSSSSSSSDSSASSSLGTGLAAAAFLAEGAFVFFGLVTS